MILNNKHANCVHRHVHYTLVCNLNVLINYGLLRQEKTKQYKQHRPIFVKIENCSHVLLREHNPILVYIYIQMRAKWVLFLPLDFFVLYFVQ